MAIVQTVNFSIFSNTFFSSQYKNNFSYQGLCVLFDYLEGLSDDTGENIELDTCAIASDYAESTFDEIADQYSMDLGNDFAEDEKRERVMEYLEKNTVIVGETSEGFVYLVF